MKLTDTKIRAIKPIGKAQKFTDGKGLYLHMSASGFLAWRIDYAFEGKRKTLTLGAYPSVSLSDARRQLLEVKSKLVEGIDPSAQKQALKAARRAEVENTFEHVAREWIGKQEHMWTPKHLRKITAYLEHYIFPQLGAKDVKSVTPLELLDALRIIESKGYYETAHATLGTCGQIFRYAIATGKGERDTAADLRGALKPKIKRNFPTITDPKQIGILLKNIDEYEGSIIVRTALQIAPYVFTRPSELRCATWNEFDLTKKEWLIPASRMKMRREHIVPLADQVVKLLQNLYAFTGHTKYLFPSMRANTAPISDATLLAGLRRMGYSKDEIVVHSFRSMASTLLNEQGYNSDWIEKQLNHEKNDVRGVYNKAEYMTERRKMMQAWADYLDGLKDSKAC